MYNGNKNSETINVEIGVKTQPEYGGNACPLTKDYIDVECPYWFEVEPDNKPTACGNHKYMVTHQCSRGSSTDGSFVKINL